MIETNHSHTAERETFVLRLWRETPECPDWRGQVQNVQTGQIIYVRGPEELLSYIQSQMKGEEQEHTHKSGLK